MVHRNFLKSFKVEKNERKFENLEIKKTLFVEIKNNKKITIKKSCDLILIFDNFFKSLNIKIKVLENLKVNIITITNDRKNENEKNFSKIIKVEVLENSKLNFISLSKNFIFEKNIIGIFENSKCKIFNLNFLDNSISNYKLNEIKHRGENTNSNISAFCFVDNKTTLGLDNLSFIKKRKSNCFVNQKAKGFILDENSKIFFEPILEINSSEVEVSHSASICEFLKNEKYYLKSRGLCEDEILNIFFRDVFFNMMENTNLTSFEKGIIFNLTLVSK